MATTTLQIQTDIMHVAIASSTIRSFTPNLHILSRTATASTHFPRPLTTTSLFRIRAFSTDASESAVKLPQKPPICTADELHYVSVANSDWRLALWRYHPSPQAPSRNHPLLLLSGVGTNAIGYDLSPGMEYIRAQCKPKDGKLLAIGHSMGGILLYSMLSRCGFEGKDPKLAAIVTLASSLDYKSSKSTLKLLLPLADPAQALNVPVVPLGALLAAAYPLSSRPPYVLSWLNHLISAEDMMHPELLEKLVLNNFCTIPAKLILQLTTAFREGGLCDRSGKFFYKDHTHKSNVPVLALAGDQDLICPPEAVEETAKLIPENLVTYKVFGEPGGPHYAHYDLVGGRLAVEQVYPCIIQFVSRYD